MWVLEVDEEHICVEGDEEEVVVEESVERFGDEDPLAEAAAELMVELGVFWILGEDR